MQHNFSGIWLSKYTYHSNSRDQDFEDAHYVEMHQKRNGLVIESLPEVNESYLIINLKLHDNLATGTWQETTSPNGYYKGATYHGAMQLAVQKDGKSMRGMWIGAGKDGVIKAGPHELVYIGKELPAHAKPVRAA